MVELAHAAEWGLSGRRMFSEFVVSEYVQPPGRHLPWHEHTDASICFVLAGSYRERVGSREHECATRSLFFKPANARHTDRFGTSGGRCLLVEIAPRRVESVDRLTNVLSSPSPLQSVRGAAIGFRLHHEYAAPDTVSPLAVEGLVFELLVEASRRSDRRRSAGSPVWLRAAREMLHDGLDERLTLSDVARTVNIHPSHLARVFRQRYGVSIGDYVRSLRVERAASDLAESTRSLATIASRAGFFDQSHFTRVFKAHTGITPAAYRASARGGTSRTHS